MEDTTNIYFMDKDTVRRQIVQNLVESGVLQPPEVERYSLYLTKLNSAELILQLIEAHNLREITGVKVKYYQINMANIVPN